MAPAHGSARRWGCGMNITEGTTTAEKRGWLHPNCFLAVWVLDPQILGAVRNGQCSLSDPEVRSRLIARLDYYLEAATYPLPIDRME
jgi:hypothetical protein